MEVVAELEYTRGVLGSFRWLGRMNGGDGGGGWDSDWGDFRVAGTMFICTGT